jgi:hypothetical protein
VGEDAAQRVVAHLADEGRPGAEARHADDGVRRRAAGNLHRRSHRLVDALGLLLDDQRHRPLAHGVTNEEIVIGAGDDVDDGVADAENVVADVRHAGLAGKQRRAL